METAKEILNQLGGNRFIAMTGCKNFIGDNKSLSMKLSANKKKWTHLKITLNDMDTYDMKFMQFRKFDVIKEEQETGIYADMLQSVFTARTGLYTKL